MTNLEQSRSQIPYTWSVILIFSLILTFNLTKTENRTKSLSHKSHTTALSGGTTFAKNTDFLRNNADISKINGVQVLNKFPETIYVCTYITYFKFLA